MEKQASEYGLLGIDLGSFVNNRDEFVGCAFDTFGRNQTLNDICDVLNTEGGMLSLKKMIDRELTTKRVVQSSAKDVLTDVERRRDAHCVTVLRFDDFELLRSYEKILVEKYGAAAVTLISSKSRDLKQCKPNSYVVL